MVGDKIARLRKRKGIPQKDFAQLLQVTPSAVSQWENGKTTPDISLLKKIADILQTSVSDLMGETVKERKPTDDDLKFALFGGDGDITDAQLEEVRRFAAYVKSRDQHGKP